MSFFSALVLLVCGCPEAPSAIASGDLVINEVMTDNDAAWIDEAGEVGDWLEIGNVSQHSVQLERFELRDDRGRSYRLPAQSLAAGALRVIFVDGDAKQGPLHASWKLSAQGVTLSLIDTQTGETSDRVTVPALALNQTYARFPNLGGTLAVCRYASPERDNGASCGPETTPELTDRPWASFQWPERWPASNAALVVAELALKPARFISVENRSDSALDLRSYQLQVAAAKPGLPWPTVSDGGMLDWGEPTELPAHATRQVNVDQAALGALATDPLFEGVVTLYDVTGSAVERVDFMRWPDQASLVRVTPDVQRFRFCEQSVSDHPGSTCTPLARREVGERLRHLYTPGDYAALAAGDVNLGLRGVKFVVDLLAGSAVHLLSARSYALHYTFVREQIEHAPALDRCDPQQAQIFMQGWIDFSQLEYFRSQGRRYLLGTLDTYAGSELHVLDFAVGDQIVAAQMQHAFFQVMTHLDSETPERWAIHPTEPRQENELALLQGQVPIVGANAPFRNLRYQPLSPGLAFGQLMFMPADMLEHANLGPDRIVVTDAVPNDIPFVSGLITEAFQTPLAHVNVLSQNRGTPNMALRDARRDTQIAALLGKLVRFEVSPAGYSLRAATSEEVAAFQKSRMPQGPRIQPRLDRDVRGPIDLAGRGLPDLPSIGAKAAQLAELGHIEIAAGACAGKLPLPAAAFAIPLVHSLEHFERSGAAALLRAAEQRPEFQADPAQRAAVLTQMREAIQNTALDPELFTQLESLIAQRFSTTRLRFRSSSNTEDLPGFNGAGLYESWSGALSDPERPIADAIRSVWASLWNARAYDERELGNIDQHGVAMGVLVHPAFLSERANIIVVSRDLQDPTRADVHTMNAQAGEASVANPAPGVSTEELLHHVALVPGTPELEYRRQSSLTHGAPVLSLQDAQQISCLVSAIHDHFRPLLDPTGENRWFAMDVELKLVGPERQAVVKQARPLSFGRLERPSDCREY
jgi:hypothetical protein